MRRGFTLIELIVVIIIVGILAAVGISQYSTVVEKGRGAEARIILGDLVKLAYQYRLENGSITGITNTDLNIGTGADQIPTSCRSTHYFYYYVRVCGYSDPLIEFGAARCTSGGKSPQGPSSCACSSYALKANLSTGGNKWQTNCNCSCVP